MTKVMTKEYYDKRIFLVQMCRIFFIADAFDNLCAYFFIFQHEKVLFKFRKVR